jgi:hypothetical protein
MAPAEHHGPPGWLRRHRAHIQECLTENPLHASAWFGGSIRSKMRLRCSKLVTLTAVQRRETPEILLEPE